MRWTPQHITERQHNAVMNTEDDMMMEEAERLVAFNLSEFEGLLSCCAHQIHPRDVP